MRFILFCFGGAALGWQVLWALHLGLALGASARGVALTVGTAMAGMTLGAFLGSALVKRFSRLSPILLYGAIELVVALGALLPGLSESWIMSADSRIYRISPLLATPFSLVALALTLAPACVAMGATLPVMGTLARATGTPLSRLYAFNTAGAAVGTIIVAFLLLPWLGLKGSSLALFLIQATLCAACFFIASAGRNRDQSDGRGVEEKGVATGIPPLSHRRDLLLVFLSGFAAFLLEVTWFRALRAAWFSTSDSAAVMLCCFLLALAIGAAIAPAWRRHGFSLSIAFAGAAILTLIANQLIARFDLIETFQAKGLWRQISRLLAGLLVLGPPVALLGIILPSILDRRDRPGEWAALYATNTLGSVLGANLAAWMLLEWVGPLASGWIAAALLAAGAWVSTTSPTLKTATCLAFAAVLAPLLWFDRHEPTRVKGASRFVTGGFETIAQRHGPDASISVIAHEGGRVLVINGFATAGESHGDSDARFRYMDSMGRLPMLLHPDPRNALVICFGTGQTAHAVRDENPARLDLVDLNAAVFELGDLFDTNHHVLDDPRVRAIVMDGRAWLRRSEEPYDVITLEPMPPFFSGTNALYSVEFYRLARERLQSGGLAAQWFPLHLMTPEQAASIAAAFTAVFPDSILWLDPDSRAGNGLADQGILIGRKPDNTTSGAPLGETWPGFLRAPLTGTRRLTADQTRRQIALSPAGLQRFAAGAAPVTDTNQLLEFGTSPYRNPDYDLFESIRRIHERIEAAREDTPLSFPE
ncbi:MAG: fused MFS/spermidine synthase [Verrucomicrobiales bacterium]|nr:fused MFS/spermidine synthase [Verrucomicrobiales bacterium]